MIQHRRPIGRVCLFLFLVTLMLPAVAPAQAAKTWSPDHERRVSEEGAKEILAEAPEWADEAQKARCQKLLDEIAVHCPRPDVQHDIGAATVPEGEEQPPIRAGPPPGP